MEPQVVEEKAQIRFAEDIPGAGPTKPGAKSRKGKKKSVRGKRGAEDSIRTRRVRREPEVSMDDEY